MCTHTIPNSNYQKAQGIAKAFNSNCPIHKSYIWQILIAKYIKYMINNSAFLCMNQHIRIISEGSQGKILLFLLFFFDQINAALMRCFFQKRLIGSVCLIHSINVAYFYIGENHEHIYYCICLLNALLAICLICCLWE